LTDLSRAKRMMNAMPADKFRERIEIRFETDFRKHQQSCLALLHGVCGGRGLPDCWRKVAVIDSELRPLLDECVALLQGTMARRAGLDDGVCDIADALLEHLSGLADVGWRRFTVPGSEYLTERTGIVQVRFPAASIWDLPFAAHEFAHSVEPQITAVDEDGTRFEILTRLLTNMGIEAQQQAFLREHFADVLATYAVGPMFGWAAAVLYFDPLSAFDSEGQLDRHPSSAKRMHIILRTLEAMDETRPEGEPVFEMCRVEMKKLWGETLAAAGHTTELDGGTIAQLNREQSDLFQIIDDNLPLLRYAGWEQAQALAERVGDDDSLPLLGANTSIVDVLNAAWVKRLARPGADVFELHRIEGKSEKICHMIIKGVRNNGFNV